MISLRMLLDLYCLSLRLEYNCKVAQTFFDKVHGILFDRNTDKFLDYKSAILHCIAYAHSAFERRLLRKFYEYIKTYEYPNHNLL